MNNQTPPFLTAVLNGIGQIMLQENAWTGLLFLIGIFYGDVQMGLAALAGTVTGTLTARLLGYDDKEIRMGLYGFSPALVGVALTFLFAANGIVWVLVIAGAAMAAVLQHFFIVRKVPVFTFPFIVVTWALVFLLHKFTGYPPSSSLLAPADLSDPSDFTTSTNGFGEVIFQGSFFAGLLFFVAVFVSNPVAALYGLAGSILAAAISVRFSEPMPQIRMGLFSFNAVLCAITFSGTRRIDGVLVLIAVVLATLIDIFLLKSDFSILTRAGGVLTFPFVLGSWLTLPLKKLADRHFAAS
ncbi:urea transporter [Siphonobacter aquaeclarae]|jgi:urea transporter|uniref:Urea transporter n=1 Tax=Siphonobacter aquaeclarae TaxID=563176 RepID=A0A1G9Y273_9BACT|nr:urea transporter [Siphonobacter aquaeclarae]SDN03120.1 urea transporter [Siphonobacter aquaeclarae]